MGTYRDIISMKIRGADNIAVEALRHLLKFSKVHGFGNSFRKEMKKLLETRPTAVVLHNALEVLEENTNEKTITELIQRIEKDRIKVANFGQHLIKNGYVVHTHCNSSEALGIIKKAARKKKFTVVADETRPRLQGLITVRELAGLKNLKVILIVDSAAGFAMTGASYPKADIVLVGADALRKEGLVNKIGTYMLALAAKENKIPFYAAASTMKLDRRDKIEIEERPASEVCKKLPKGKITIRNPAFDITPWRFVSGIITEKGILSPQKLTKLLER